MTRDFGGGRNVVMPMRWKRSPPTAAIILPTCWSCWNGKIPCRSIILCQDATMQRRMEMGLRKYRPQGMEIINYAAYQAEVVAQGSQLTYREAIPGMWTVDRYVNLLMGEIPV